MLKVFTTVSQGVAFRVANWLFRSNVSGDTVVGEHSYVARSALITRSRIGRYCSIAPGAMVGLGEHNHQSVTTSTIFVFEAYDRLTSEPCILENDIWVGAGAVIVRGVTVGNGAVIAAGAVVTKNVPAFAIVGGVPAKVIKYRFPSDIRIAIESSQWWNKSKKEARLEILRLEQKFERSFSSIQ